MTGMSYDLDPLQANCYPGTGVLENRFGIQNAQKLEEVEAVITTTRAAQWLADPDELMIATIQASQGVIDMLRQIMEQIIE